MGQLASELLAEALADKGAARAPFRWKSADLGEPLVDLEDKAAVQALLDQRK